jgi:hypothetical protein
MLYLANLMYRPTESAGNKFITKIKRKNKNNILANNNRNSNKIFKISSKLYIPTRSALLPPNEKFSVPALVIGSRSYTGLKVCAILHTASCLLVGNRTE